jgi:hypothetical protein
MSEEKRIYSIVAKTVQAPCIMRQVPSKTRWIIAAGPDTKTIVQPPGRIAAQHGHVVSHMRMHHLLKKDSRLHFDLANLEITTIILSVPDSYQLHFMHYLLSQKLGPDKVYHFLDENDEYGPYDVKTAICTVPVLPTDVEGVIDYLPLWDGK